MTQPVYDIQLFENFMNRIHDVKIPILLGILPLASSKNAEFLHNEVPGMSIPEHIRKRMHAAGNGEKGGTKGSGSRRKRCWIAARWCMARTSCLRSTASTWR